MEENIFDIRKADAAYKSFPSCSSWKNIVIDPVRWDRNIARLESITKEPSASLEHAKKVVRRIAAIETGAIEKLYEVERGFTWSVAIEIANVQALLLEKGTETKNLIESQLSAYDFILDLATGKRKLTEAWIRELHEVLCGTQESYLVQTPQGPTQKKLPLGEYKKASNHVIKKDGKVHSYAPTDFVGAEMHRLLNEISSVKFADLHPVVQAAYSHYAFVCIHPFADGNGRVARALSSIFLYRAYSIPVLILSEDRTEYLDSLESADDGEYQKFVDFAIERCFSAIDFIELSFKASNKVDIKQNFLVINEFYLTKGGFTHEQVDQTAHKLFKSFYEQLKEKLNSIRNNSNIGEPRIDISDGHYPSLTNEFRLFITGKGKLITISISSKLPYRIGSATELQIHIPKDCDINDEYVILNLINKDTITIRMSEVYQEIKPSLRLKLDIFADSILNDLVDNLVNKMKKTPHK